MQESYEVDNRFACSLLRIVGKRYLGRFFLPWPVRRLLYLVRALRYVRTGLGCLLRGELTVEVLDAAAVAASLLRGTFDSAGSIMFLLSVSSLLEEYTHTRSRLALEQSLALNVEDVWLVTDDCEMSVPLSKVRKGDRIRVRTGSLVPVDGVVADGVAMLNESSMTGESKLVAKDAGSTVFAGTVVEDGNIVVEVRSTGSDTRISRIVQMVDESEKLKAGIQGRAERLADAIVPYSFLAFFVLLMLTRNITKAMAVLMVDYSCAIRLSTPVAVMSAMREAANRGIVVKGGRYLEVLAEADVIIFDKTGTLTTATPAVGKVLPLGDMDEGEVLKLAACLEEHFPHSVARAVVAEAELRGIHHEDEQHAEVEYIVAHGIASAVDGKRVVLGSAHYVFDDEGIDLQDDVRKRIADNAPGSSVIYMAVDGTLQGAICIDDPIRVEARQTVSDLREAGFRRIIMLTGDAEGAAEVTAAKLGVDEYRSQMLPEDKSAIVNECKKAGHTVVMVGDGINDSPSLAAADASIAMVDASDIAREVADITLLDSSLDSILELRRLSRRLMGRINRNYHVIVGFNTGLIVAGVAGLLPPTTSALLHNLSTMAITAESMQPLLTEGRSCEKA